MTGEVWWSTEALQLLARLSADGWSVRRDGITMIAEHYIDNASDRLGETDTRGKSEMWHEVTVHGNGVLTLKVRTTRVSVNSKTFSEYADDVLALLVHACGIAHRGIVDAKGVAR